MSLESQITLETSNSVNMTNISVRCVLYRRVLCSLILYDATYLSSLHIRKQTERTHSFIFFHIFSSSYQSATDLFCHLHRPESINSTEKNITKAERGEKQNLQFIEMSVLELSF